VVRFARFIAVGAANTAASYGVYLLLLYLGVDYRIAYTAAYLAGLAFGYWAHATFVFRARLRARSAVAYVATYAAMYVASLGMLAIAVDYLLIPKPAAMLAALCVTIPASYLLLRRGFRA
jgi:putative flippase GtrA